MTQEISQHFFQSLGLADKQIRSYYKNLKSVRAAITQGDLGPDPEEHFFELEGGLRFFYQVWMPRPSFKGKQPRAVAFVFHDIYGSSDIFYPLADILTKYNVMVVGYDYRGHGRTAGHAGGNLGDLKAFNAVFGDISKLIRHFDTKYNAPIFLIGYDLGGLIAMRMAKQANNPKIEAIVLISPILKLKKQLKHLALYPIVSIGSLISKNQPVHRVIPEKVPASYLEEYQKFKANDPLYLKFMSFRLFKQILDLINTAPRLISKINVPCIFFQGTDDHIVDHIALEKRFPKWAHPKKKIRFYPKGGHNLLMDKFTQEIYGEITDFLELS